jgi:catechol 2,3-dioxygenase-like lactoylglutathione lyase family enzyme
MLTDAELIPFIGTTQPDAAKAFYGDKLGLKLIADTPVAVVFQAGTTVLWMSKVEKVQPPSYTVIGWRVLDIRATVTELTRRGVVFERYPSMEQDDLGIWTAPGGARVAWFKDPDGNTLSVAEGASILMPGPNKKPH